MKPTYEPDGEPAYRAECDLCDWWETAMRFGEVRLVARGHMVQENPIGNHDNATVTIWRALGQMVNKYEVSR